MGRGGVGDPGLRQLAHAASPGQALSGPRLVARLGALGGFLAEGRALWAPRPFLERPAPWEAAHPPWAAWLRGLDDEALEALEAGAPLPPEAPAGLRALAARAAALTEVPRFEAPPLAVAPDALRGVPGRKQAQLAALSALALPHLPAPGGLVDWCAGKAHLGRCLGLATGCEVLAVEHDPALAEDGRALAARAGLPLRYLVADARGEAAARALAPDRVALALHACGALHQALIDAALARGARAVVVAPCCYHRAPPEQVLRSRAARSSGLTLDPYLLRLATAEEVVAGARLKRLRRQELAWRLGLAATLPGLPPLPAAPGGLVGAGFEAFAEGMFQRLGLRLPPAFDAAAAEARGWEEAGLARRLSLLRGLYRRPLELFLALDRAVGLLEAGWEVQLGRFCARALTPRDLALVARPGAVG